MTTQTSKAETMASKPLAVKQFLVITQLKAVEIPSDVMTAEYQMTNDLREKGVIEHLFANISQGKLSGGTVVFNIADENEVRKLVKALPLDPYFAQVTYLPIEKIY